MRAHPLQVADTERTSTNTFVDLSVAANDTRFDAPGSAPAAKSARQAAESGLRTSSGDDAYWLGGYAGI